VCAILQNCVPVGQTVAFPEILGFFDIFKMATDRHLGYVMSVFGQPTESARLYLCTKFRCNRCRSVDDVQVLIFSEFGLKAPIHATKWKIGDYTRKWEAALIRCRNTSLIVKIGPTVFA